MIRVRVEDWISDPDAPAEGEGAVLFVAPAAKPGDRSELGPAVSDRGWGPRSHAIELPPGEYDLLAFVPGPAEVDFFFEIIDDCGGELVPHDRFRPEPPATATYLPVCRFTVP
jgi:hypothetical protein